MKYIISIATGLFIFSAVASAQYNNGYNNSHFSTTQNGLLNGASTFTVEFWVKTSENRSNDLYWQRPYFFGNATNGDNSGDFGITSNSGYVGMWEGISNLNTDQQFLSNGTRINDNFWHHVAAVNNGQTLNLYVDGNIIGSLVSGRQLITTTAPLTFGGATLDFAYSGNVQGNVNFTSQSLFGEARISNTARYSANFMPLQHFVNDEYTVALYHLDQNTNQNNNGYNQNSNQSYNQNQSYSQQYNPNEPVTFEPNQTINDNAAQAATLYVTDSMILKGKLLLGKKDWTLSNEIYIRFFEGNSKKVKYYKAEEIKGFQMGDSYFEPKFLGQGGAIPIPMRKTMVKRLTPAGSKMAMYEYEGHSTEKNANGYIDNKNIHVYFVQLPHSNDDKVYQFSDNKFTPHFDSRVSNLVADNPGLAEKIKSKQKDYFYAFITEDKHQYNVWWNIVNEYNR